MSSISLRDLLEAGVHFGHQTRYWNPKMSDYIFGSRNDIHIINLDKLTYAGNLENLRDIENADNYIFEKGDVCDAQFINKILSTYEPDCILHLAAESHVDNSIKSI